MTELRRPKALFRDVRSREVIEALLAIHFPDVTSIVDATWGKGAFWRGHEPVVGLDIVPRLGCQLAADATDLPLRSQAVDLAVFDPPFTFSRGKNPGSTKVHEDFSFLPNYDSLLSLCRGAAEELRRVARLGAIVKLADSVKHGKFHSLHIDAVNEMRPWLGGPEDIAILDSGVVRPDGPNWGAPKHLRNTHSYFFVYVWGRP